MGRQAIFWGLAALAALSLAASAHGVSVNPEGAFYLPQYRVWELLVGSLLAIAVKEDWLRAALSRAAMSVPLALAGLAAIVWAMLTYQPDTQFPGLAALPPCLGTVALIATGHYCATPVSRVLETAPMVWVGKLSYSLYLWHWPVIVFLYYTNVDHLNALQGLGCIAASFALAWLSYRFVEQPVRLHTRDARTVLFLGGGGAMAVAIVIGLGFSLGQGLPGRFAPSSVALLEGDFLHDRRDCHFVTPARAQAGDVCVRGASGVAPTMMLLGDSHADALSPGFFAAAEIAGIAGYQYTNAGFRPLPGVEKQGVPSWGPQADALTAFLDARPAVRTIYITSFWQHQITGASYRHAGDVWIDDGYDDTGSAYNPVALANGLTRLVTRFPERQFVLLDDVPAGDILDLRTAVRALRFGHVQAPAELGLPVEEFAAQQALFSPLFEQLSATHDNLSFLPVFAALCDTRLCPLFADETPLYRDGDHLSAQGALKLAKPLYEELFSRTGNAI